MYLRISLTRSIKPVKNYSDLNQKSMKENLMFGLVSLFNGMLKLCGLFNAKTILVEKEQ